MKILVLGGTIFLGRHIVEQALKRNHEITLFNRGEHSADLFPELEKIRGNRDGDLDKLKGRKWDAVIDPSGYVPRIVKASAELLSEATGHYTFISTVSVFDNFKIAGMDENGPLGRLEDETVEQVTGDTYGPLKVLCEKAVEEAMPGRTLIVRPGLIVGPHDPTDRFTYWPSRVADGGKVLAPGNPENQIQFIDVRDLAAWTVQMVEQKQIGIFNATGPDYVLTMGNFLTECKQTTHSNAEFIWADEKFLLDNNVKPWSEIPLWVPSNDENMVGFSKINCHKAIEAGLKFRPLQETIKDTLEWAESRSSEVKNTPKAGLGRERETELLQSWQTKISG